MRTCNITHLVIIEHSFTTLIAGHVGDVTTIPIKVYSPAGQRETDAGRVFFAYYVGRDDISVNSGRKRGHNDRQYRRGPYSNK
jgi:hypothetical protein